MFFVNSSSPFCIGGQKYCISLINLDELENQKQFLVVYLKAQNRTPMYEIVAGRSRSPPQNLHKNGPRFYKCLDHGQAPTTN